MTSSKERPVSHAMFIEVIEQTRRNLIHTINRECDMLVQLVAAPPDRAITESARYYPLHNNGRFFKGKKPVSVILPDGREENVRTWKHVCEVILRDSISDAEIKQTLMGLRGKIAGRDRLIVSDTADGMGAPIRIADDLYFEAKYDTETLLYVLTQRVLSETGYDCKAIMICVR